MWVEPTPENALRVFEALARFGAPLTGLHPDDFSKSDLIYQIGMPPTRVGILTSITGVDFAGAWLRRKPADYGDVQAFFIGLEDLIRNKRATGRPVDLVDCEQLEQAPGNFAA